MSKTLPAEITAALSAAEMRPFFTVELALDSGRLSFWTGTRNITIGDTIYTGAGSLLEIGASRETADLSAVGLTLSLSGLDASVVSLSLTESWQGREVLIKFGVLDSDDQPSDLMTIWSGLTDQLDIEGNPDGTRVVLTAESKLIDLQRARIRRYTPESQKAYFPNDKAFDFVADLQDKKILFGQSDKGASNESRTGQVTAFARTNV